MDDYSPRYECLDQTPVKNRFRETGPEEIRFCSIVKAELWFGAFNSSRQRENLNLLRRLFSNYESLPFDDGAAEIYGRIRAELNAQGTPIGPNDLLIAAVALTHNSVIITHNTREFKKVGGLTLKDWEV